MVKDYLIVGAGLFGSVTARTLAEAGCRVRLIDRRPHLGGNCYSEQVEGVEVHRYGPHIFHTNNLKVWEFVNRFTRMNHYRHRGVARARDRMFALPINLMTLHQLWGVRTPGEAEQRLAEVRVPIEQPRNAEEWMLSQVGPEIYETFFHGYTTKQWGREPKDLPAAIVRRLPIRLTWDDNYFNDRYQGIPEQGYTRMFENMLDHPLIRIETGVDFLSHRKELLSSGSRLLYSGQIDEYFGFRLGPLEYRSLRFETQQLKGDFQGASIVNYSTLEVPYTRIVEHKHFLFQNSDATVITYEYPAAWKQGGEAFYPVRDAANGALFDRYQQLAQREAPHVLFGGRLGSYQYYDMHQVIGEALQVAQAELNQSHAAAA